MTRLYNSIDNNFYHEVYNLVAQIPAGKVLTYGLIAQYLGRPRHTRWVGRALKEAPKEMYLPAWRVVNSQGRTAPGWPEQQDMLEYEGVSFKKNGMVDLAKHLWHLPDKSSI